MALDIEFPESTSAEAGRLAQALQHQLLERGLPAEQMSLQRQSTEDMTFGDILSLTNVALDTLIALHGTVTFAHILHSFVAKHKSAIILKTEHDQVIHIKADTAVDALSEVLKRLKAPSGGE